ncbi:MAG: pilus assembly protein PilP [Gammaproteobacteria bacterium]|nr:pilus assembly protein PilP [Gammaproteobacteria bacterium]
MRMDFLIKSNTQFKVAGIISLAVLFVAILAWWFFRKPITAYSVVQEYVQEVRNRPGKALDRLEKFPVYISLPYTSDMKRSPFSAKFQDPKLMQGEGPDLNRPRGELESFALDALKMVGVIRQDNTIWAVILAPNNTIYRIKTGDFIGKNYGKVVSISSTDIEISESISDGYGLWVKRPAVLTLSE